MTDDLIARLRDGVLYGDARLHNPKGHDPLRMEAADRIEELTAEVERLRERLAEAYQIAGHIAVEYDGNGKIERLLDLLAGINPGDSHE